MFEKQIPANLVEKFQDDVLSLLNDTYIDQDGKEFQGQAVSFVKTEMHAKGWKNLGPLSGFEDCCRTNGFTLVHAKNRRGNKAIVVTL